MCLSSKWIKIPCYQKVLDIHTLYSSRKKNVRIPDKQAFKAPSDSQSNFIKRNNKSNPQIFYCNDGHVIILPFICNGVDDCPDRSDEVFCSCIKNSLETHYPVFNLSSHPFSNFVCKEPLEKKRHGGCGPYKMQHIIIKNTTHNCSSEKIKCTYQIVGTNVLQNRPSSSSLQ